MTDAELLQRAERIIQYHESCGGCGNPMLTTATKIATFYGKEISELWTPIKSKKAR